MSGVHRFLSRRGRNKERPSQTTAKTDHFGGVFTVDNGANVKSDKEEDRRVEGILERLRNFGITDMVESNARYALRATQNQGDGEAAFRLLMLLQDTYEGLLKPYRPEQKILGAVNREFVTCYLDALLFSMFGRLDSFEAMLYDHFEDAARKKLAGLLRLWVNMVRTGRLVTTDVTKQIQEALASCGWREAALLKQQDPSEAFTFITGQLELPLLTLKMDLYHTGKEEPQDDHKFINERLLEVALLDKPPDGRDVITLEDCLEHYFNNRIEVKRHLESQRRNTLKSATSNPMASPTKVEKESDIHIETVEIASPSGSVLSTPTTEFPLSPIQSKNPIEKLRPTGGRQRADSIFSQRKVALNGANTENQPKTDEQRAAPERKMSTKTEVLMPAWQFFQLLPWYTDHLPTSDAQVAAHFSKKRPVLGICLKRYSYTAKGEARRLDTFVDIPLEIAVPNFVSDENMQDNGPLIGNFRLLLQSVVCHRGVSVHSGHYVALCRMKSSDVASQDPDSRRSSESDEADDPWVRFDDLAKERVSPVDIHQALRQETPYLLFYQVQPIDADGCSIHELPTYAEAISRSHSEAALEEKPYLNDAPGSEYALQEVTSNTVSNDGRHGPDGNDISSISGRPSLDMSNAFDGPRGRSSVPAYERRRGSTLAFADDSNVNGSVSGGSVRTDNNPSIPTTPSEEKSSGTLLGIANKIVARSRSTRMSRGANPVITRSRPSSAGPSDANASRFSLNMTRLTKRASRDESQPPSDRPRTSEGSIVAEQNGETMRQDPVPSVVVYDGRNSVDRAKPDVIQSANTGDNHSHSSPPKRNTTLTKPDKRKKKHRTRDQEDRDCVMM